jgi:hypothetical protein
MAIRRFSTAKPGVKSNQLWDQDTAQGAMVPIASYRLVGSEVYSFINIPQIYQDLVVVVNGVSTPLGATLAFDQFNGISASNQSNTRLTGDGSTIFNTRQTSTNGLSFMYIGGGVNNIIPISAVFNFMDYASSTKQKSILWRTANAASSGGEVSIGAALWASTSPLTQFNITTQVVGAYWTEASTVNLYGIKAGA